jgi:SAM-dependent methyltransferase
MTEIKRNGITYTQHPNGTLTCGPLDQSGMVGGSGEEVRNQEHNPTRLQRIKEFHPSPMVLDFGCGSGMLVKYLRDNGIEAMGADKYAAGDKWRYIYSDMLSFDDPTFDVVTMIEVIEHLSAPYDELEAILACLKPGGVLMVETSFTDWMDLANDSYINPALGHSTIFSHQGLDDLMAEKGFEVYGHINRNVRIYKKPEEKAFEPKITLITMGQGNPIALKRTIESFKDIVDEIIFGDLLIFESDREVITQYVHDYPLEIVRLPFNHIFEHGFAATLNELADHATNDWVLYMNVGEVLHGEHPIKEQMSNLYNCYSFDHAVDPHHWFRLYNREELSWGGLIHEEVVGKLRPCPFVLFRMQDTEKDLDDPFKAKVANDVKELCYFQAYVRLVDNPELRANTHQGWIDYATRDYDSLKERLLKKGKRYEAFQKGDLQMYLDDICHNPEFAEERFKSNDLINFQGNRKLL